ncbi:MAG: DUF2336 domain-containing protein [Xanthobacteraceae bacterium]
MRDSGTQSLIDELNRTVVEAGPQQRKKILQRITDLFAAGSRGYSGKQLALFDDVLQELSTDIEVEVRAKLSERLAHLDCAPPKVIRSLAFDDAAEVATPVLMHSNELSEADLIENAATKSQKHLLAIAQRLKVSEKVTDVLVIRGDKEVALAVVQNKGARFSLAGYGMLVVRARQDDVLTLALGERNDVPRQIFLKLLEGASASVRAALERADPQSAPAIRGAVDDVATAMQRATRGLSQQYSAAVLDAKQRSNVAPLSEASVHARARAQEFERTVVALSKLGHFRVDVVERALLDKGEDMILILAKAAGCSWTTVKELLLMYVAERNLSPDDLGRASERYQKLGETTARKVIRFYESRMRARS